MSPLDKGLGAAVVCAHGSRAELIGKKMADEIVLGRFKPGERLDETLLAGLFKVSRTPVREALKQLATQGLVVCRPNRGAFVAEMSPEQLDHMFETIGELEAACARSASLRMNADVQQQLLALHTQSFLAMQADDFEHYDQLNQDFHGLIIQNCGNPTLIEITLGLHHRVLPFRRSQFRHVERMKASFEEHALIIAALLTRDADSAHRETRAHLLSARSATARMTQRGATASLMAGSRLAPIEHLDNNSPMKAFT